MKAIKILKVSLAGFTALNLASTIGLSIVKSKFTADLDAQISETAAIYRDHEIAELQERIYKNEIDFDYYYEQKEQLLNTPDKEVVEKIESNNEKVNESLGILKDKQDAHDKVTTAFRVTHYAGISGLGALGVASIVDSKMRKKENERLENTIAEVLKEEETQPAPEVEHETPGLEDLEIDLSKELEK